MVLGLLRRAKELPLLRVLLVEFRGMLGMFFLKVLLGRVHLWMPLQIGDTRFAIRVPLRFRAILREERRALRRRPRVWCERGAYAPTRAITGGDDGDAGAPGLCERALERRVAPTGPDRCRPAADRGEERGDIPVPRRKHALPGNPAQ